MNKQEGSAFGISLLVHASILVLVMALHMNDTQGGEKGEGANQDNSDGNIIAIEMIDAEKLQESYLSKESDMTVEEKKKEKPPEKTVKEEDCKNFFGGIGIEFNWVDGKVSKVISNYPAANAGIIVGDILLPVGSLDIRGEVGTPLTISVNRDGNIFYVNVIRGKICLDPPKTIKIEVGP